MKVCSACGATYSDRIDFCFHDGSPLSAHSGSAAEAPVPRTLRADVSDNRSKRRSLFGSTADAPPPRVVSRPSVPAVILEAPDFVPAPLPAIHAEPPRAFKSPAPPPAPDPETFEWVAPPPPIGADPEEAPPVPVQRSLTPRVVEPSPEPTPPPDPSEEPTAEVAAPEIVSLHVTSDATPAPVAAAQSPHPADRRGPSAALAPADPSPWRGDKGVTPQTSQGPTEEEPDFRPARPAWMIPLVIAVALMAMLAVVGLAVVVIGGAALTGVESAAHTPEVAPVVVPVPPPDPTPPTPPPTPAETDAPVADVVPPVDPAVPPVPDPKAPVPDPKAPAPDPKAPPAPKPDPKVDPKVDPKPAPGAPENPWAVAPVANAKVTIKSKPPGAAITIDGAPAGTAPFDKELPPGDYIARATLAGHEAMQVAIKVPDKKVVTFELKALPEAPAPAPTGARVSIFWKGSASGGEVTVDGASKCTLPCFKTFQPGQHTFVLADGTSVTKEVTVDTKMIELP